MRIYQNRRRSAASLAAIVALAALATSCAVTPASEPAPAPVPTPSHRAARTEGGESTASASPSAAATAATAPAIDSATASFRSSFNFGAVASGVRPYNRVVTADFKTRSGLFKAHRRGDQLLYEIPSREINREFLLITQIAKSTLGAEFVGQDGGNRVVRWERRDEPHPSPRRVVRSRRRLGAAGTSRGRSGELRSDSRVVPRARVRARLLRGDRRLAAVHRSARGDRTRLANAWKPGPEPELRRARRDFPDNIEIESTLTLASGAGAFPAHKVARRRAAPRASSCTAAW